MPVIMIDGSSVWMTDGQMSARHRYLRSRSATSLTVSEVAELDAIQSYRERSAQVASRAADPYAAERIDDSRIGYQRPAVREWPAGEVGRMMSGTPDAAISRARRTIENLSSRHLIPDHSAGALDRLTRHRDPVQSWQAAQMIGVLGSEAYLRAFGKVVLDPQRGSLLLDAEERDALAQGATYARAMSVGVGGAGGYAVPLQLDPSVILTSSGSISAVRRNCRVEQGSAKEFDLVTSSGVSVGWAAEGTEASDNGPTLAQPSVTGHRLQSFIPFSMELDASWATAVAQLTSLLTDAADVEDARVRVLGTAGGLQPQGIAVALASTGAQVLTAATATVTLNDLYALQENLAPRFRGRNPRWIASLSAIHKFRSFQYVTNGESIVQGTPGHLTMLDWPLDEDSSIDALGAPTSGRNIIIGGDWQQYLIYDQLPSTVELVPHLFGTARGYPTGQRGLYLIRRTGGVCLTTAAFTMLQIR